LHGIFIYVVGIATH